MLALSTMGTVVAAIRQAREVSCTAYRLRPGPLLDALGAAASAGAAVRVRLDGTGFGGRSGGAGYDGGRGALDGNREVVDGLRARGADAALADPGGPPLHMKAVIADGKLFLDDRNWPADGHDMILTTTDPADLAAVRSALDSLASPGGPAGAGGSADAGGLATVKGRALELEVETIATAATDGVDGVDCESESFGAGRVSAALRRRAEAGEHVRLLVAARGVCASEARTLRDLQAAGVEVRLGQRGQKLAVAGSRAWVGSANATSASPATLDWGYATGDLGLVAPLRARFEDDWSAGRPLG